MRKYRIKARRTQPGKLLTPVGLCHLLGTLMSKAKALLALWFAANGKDLPTEPTHWPKKYLFYCYFFVLFLFYIYLVCVYMCVANVPWCTIEVKEQFGENHFSSAVWVSVKELWCHRAWWQVPLSANPSITPALNYLFL